ncbi:flavodoxin domain-containing protein [Streptomyces flavofungini]|uniref:flavodoxin domain-containing protein n=1 Tax=Streptomyces flavofungini TaxID=68200 RepID=UPI0025B01F2E|nr:flavodoxin domain-containing protein [Streptomyces flavofungini]WJV46618.1 flavodoxin domain-containing protein [Streptomyces flavofungini]
MRVLVGYASEHGATRGIAERIGLRLGEYGHQVDVRRLKGRRRCAGYDAFVLGSAVHSGAWMPEAGGFLRACGAELGEHPIWLFSVSMAPAVGGWFERHAKEPKPLPQVTRALPARGHRMFAGALLPWHLPAFGRLVFRLMGGRYGDFRDWKDIDSWALDIALDLSESPEVRANRP